MACWMKTRVRQAVQKVLELKAARLHGILSHFQRLVKLDIDRRTAKVESARRLRRYASSRCKRI